MTIEHMYGRTEIPAEPKRVGGSGADGAGRAAGPRHRPVATSEWYGKYPGAIFPWARDELGDVALPEVIRNLPSIQFERITALKPDLILAIQFGMEQGDYDLLSRIAPTVAAPAGSINYGCPGRT